MLHRRKAHADDWGKRRRPERYETKAIRQMLVDDAKAMRPLGGPGVVGAAFVIAACGEIAKRTSSSPEKVWTSIVAECEAATGRSFQVLA